MPNCGFGGGLGYVWVGLAVGFGGLGGGFGGGLGWAWVRPKNKLA